MKSILASFVVLLVGIAANAETVILEQPPDPNGGLHQSSWWTPDDSDWDQWIWDSFTLETDYAITEVTWRGGYIYGGLYSNTVVNFTVAIYPSIAANSEPDVVGGPLVEYTTGNNAGETYVGTYGGSKMYDYHFSLPSPFQATAGVKYWMQIEAWQTYVPEWGLATGTGGNGSHFRWLRGAHVYQFAPSDMAFALYVSGDPTFMITAIASPPNAGTVQGAGAYPAGSQAALLAIPNVGFGFVNWTENGNQVSTSANYVFTVTADRTLVANFVPAYTITTSSSPSYGGSTTGGGTFNDGSQVTVTATANPGFHFVNWTWFGAPVSDSPVYTFPATANKTLVANFATDADTVAFTFDDYPVYVALPIDVTVDGLTAHLSATGAGFSVQYADTLGFTPQGFEGHCIYPSGIFPSDLIVDFSQTLTSFSIMYSPAEFGCDDSATMRVTAYLDSAFVGTDTTTAPFPGTWPTGTLSISAPDGFNNVVVHYDSQPPTCQDWVSIFMADNMIVERPCNGASLPGDFNGDCLVGLADSAALLNCLDGPSVPVGPACADGDFDGDGDVDMQDVAGFLNAFTGG